MLLTLLDLFTKKNDELPLYNSQIQYDKRAISHLEYNELTNNYITFHPLLGELVIDSMGNCINNTSVRTTFINNYNEVVIEF